MQPPPSNRPYPGFTLLEVLAVLSLIACLSAITFWGMHSYTPSVSHTTALRTLHSLLTLAKTRAAIGSGEGAALLLYKSSNEGDALVAIPVEKRASGYVPIHPPEKLPHGVALALGPSEDPLASTYAPVIHWSIPAIPTSYAGLLGDWFEIAFEPDGALSTGPIWIALSRGGGLYITSSGRITAYESS